MSKFTEIVFYLRDFFWSGPLLFLLVGVGLYQTWSLKGIQFRFLKHALGLVVEPFSGEAKSDEKTKQTGDISSFQSLMTALAGAIGTGNITGIATAVTTGGFGALFWMWIIAFLGMATAYSETVLGLKYRVQNEEGHMTGGPMESLKIGLNAPKMAALFALLGAVAALGIGSMVQSNSVVDAIVDMYSVNRLPVGLVLMFVTGAVVLGGVSSIGRVAGVLVPIMAIMYMLVGIYILCIHYEQIIPAFQLIIHSAFNGRAAAGGLLGTTVMLAIQQGVSYGIFANEAGLGSLAIAGASAQTDVPAKQGMLSIAGVFIATMVVCTITGLVLAVTNVVGQVDGQGALLTGSPLAIAAFGSVHFVFRYVVLVGLVLFAFTTTLAWAYYGEKCIEYLFGLKCAYAYRWFYTAIVLVGALLGLEVVWACAHMANGLMAIPNLISVIGLSRVVKEETAQYEDMLKSSSSLST